MIDPRRVAALAAALAAPFATTAATSAQGDARDRPTPPTWEQLDARPLPQWFADARFGIFIHWGVYSVPAICDTSTYSEWYQRWLDTNSHDGLVRRFHDRVYGSDFAYRDFAAQFEAELFDPAQWAEVFKRAGADYVVLTSKHHDGFCLWPDGESEKVRGHAWNAASTGPRRDLVGDLAAAVRAAGLRFGLYYSFLEWHNPLFERSVPDYVERQMLPQVKDLVARYAPDIFWPDGEWEHPDATWRSRELLDWLRTNAANGDELVVNDRWGKGCRGEHGDFYTTEYGGYGGSKTYLGHKPFEECRGIGHSFAFNRLEDYDVYLSRTECVRTLIDLVSRGGKLLLDIGPDDDGTIPLIMVDRLLAIGRWLEENGESIRGCGPSPLRHTPWGRATQRDATVYLHVYDWPHGGDLRVPGLAGNVTRVWLLRDRTQAWLRYERDADGVLHVDLGRNLPSEHATVVAVEFDGAVAVDPRVVPDEEGRLHLAAAVADVEGESLRLETPQGARTGNLGFWTNTTDRAVWPRVAVEPGRQYDVLIDYAIAEGEAGGELLVTIGDRELALQFDRATGGWQHYDVASLGQFTAAGAEVAVTARARRLGARALCNLRSVTIVPSGLQAQKESAPLAWPADLVAEAGVQEQCRRMCERLRAGDLAGVAAFYGDDAVIVRPGGAPVVGREAIDAYWQRLQGAVDWQLETWQVRAVGDVVHQLGRSTLTRERDGERRQSVVDFAVTWYATAAGELKIASDVYWPPR